MKRHRPPLPPACSLCRPFEGTHRNYGTEDAPQMARCDCDRGKALAMGTRWGRPKKQTNSPVPHPAPASQPRAQEKLWGNDV